MKTKIGRENESNRIAWLEKILKQLPDNHRILDAGAGERKFEYLCKHLDYVAQDFGQYDGKGDGLGKQTGKWDQSRLDIISDITNIPEPSGSFDAIMCIEVFEHLPEPVAAICEFARLLKNNGQLIITAPFASLTHFSPYHFYSGFNKYFYEYHLKKNGFEIIELVPNGNFFEFTAQTIRQIKRRSENYCDDKPNFIEKMAVKTILKMLKRFDNKDTSSSNLLCYGYNVLARKAVL